MNSTTHTNAAGSAVVGASRLRSGRVFGTYEWSAIDLTCGITPAFMVTIDAKSHHRWPRDPSS